MRIYVAGPMRGIPEFNFPAFHAATKRLRDAGHEVFNPAEHDEGNGIDVTGTDGTETLIEQGFSIREALGADLAWICAHAQGLLMLPGYDKSRGARAEEATAYALGLDVFYRIEDLT